MKKSEKVIIISLIILTFICVMQILRLHNKIVEMQKDNTTNNVAQENAENTTDVEFVRTYYIVANLNQTDAVAENNFYVINQFQTFNPIVIKVDKKYNLEENENYEFTFKGAKIDGKDYINEEIFDCFEIINIEKTDKLGMEQRQDSI